MASSAKAVALARSLVDILKQRGYTVTQSFSTVDSDGNPAPVIQIGTGTATSASAFIKIKPEAAWGKDVLGLTQNVFTPHIIQMAVETVSGAGAIPLPYANLLEIWGEVTSRGTKAELHTSATGVAATETTITAGTNLKLSFQPVLQYPLMANS